MRPYGWKQLRTQPIEGALLSCGKGIPMRYVSIVAALAAILIGPAALAQTGGGGSGGGLKPIFSPISTRASRPSRSGTVSGSWLSWGAKPTPSSSVAGGWWSSGFKVQTSAQPRKDAKNPHSWMTPVSEANRAMSLADASPTQTAV